MHARAHAAHAPTAIAGAAPVSLGPRSRLAAPARLPARLSLLLLRRRPCAAAASAAAAAAAVRAAAANVHCVVYYKCLHRIVVLSQRSAARGHNIASSPKYDDAVVPRFAIIAVIVSLKYDDGACNHRHRHIRPPNNGCVAPRGRGSLL